MPPSPPRAKGRGALPAHLLRAPAVAVGRAAHPRCAAIPTRGPGKVRVEPRGPQAPYGKARRPAGRAPAGPAVPRELPPKMTSGVTAGPPRPAPPGEPRQLVSPVLRQGRASFVAGRGRPRVTEPGRLTGTAPVRGVRPPGRAAPSVIVRRRRTDPGRPAMLRRAGPAGAPRAAAHVTGRQSATSGAMTELRLQATVPAGQRAKTAPQLPLGRTEPRAAGTGGILTPRARDLAPADLAPVALVPPPALAQADPAQSGLALAGPVQAGPVKADSVKAGLVHAALAPAGPVPASPALVIVARILAAARDRSPPLAARPVDPARTVRRVARLAGKARRRVRQAVTVLPGRPVDAKATGRRTAGGRGLGRGKESVTGARLRPISPGRPVRRCQIRSAPSSSIPKHVPS